MSVLIIAEHDNQSLKPSTMNTITAGLALSDAVDLLVVGYQSDQAATEGASLQGVKRLIHIDHEVYEHHFAENMGQLIATLAPDYSHVLAPATAFGKNILPRAAALLDVTQISEVIKVLSEDTFVRPIYAGNAWATLKTTEKIKFLTIRTTAFPAAKLGNSKAAVERREEIFDAKNVCFLRRDLSGTERPELCAARVVVSGGRGFQDAENFKKIEPLADQLHAAIGATRAAVDAGFIGNDHQVGQTGKVVAPELYIAIGISGAIQHIAGMRESKVIVAINKDAEAPIFQIADYGLVGNLFNILPELEKQLGKE